MIILRDGGKYFERCLETVRAMASLGGETGEKGLRAALSDREYQVFRMIASGKTVSGIAEELCLSVKTVSTHRARILEKTGLKNNAEITHYAMAKHLVD